MPYDDDSLSGAGSDSSSNGWSSSVPGPIQKALKPRKPMSAGQAANAVGNGANSIGSVPPQDAVNDPIFDNYDWEDPYPHSGDEHSTVGPIPSLMAPKVGPPAEGQIPYDEQNPTAPAIDASLGTGVYPSDAQPASAQTTMPTLAGQGSSNPFVRAIQRVVGWTGAQPEPGQTYQGPTDTTSKLGALGRWLGRLSSDYTQNFGTPLDRELAVKRQELNNEAAWRMANLREMQSWHQTQGDIRQQQVDTAQQNADTKAQKLSEDEYQFQQGLIPIDATTARVLFNNPNMAGQAVPFKVWDSVLKSRGFIAQDLGPDGTWFVNRTNPNERYKLSDASLGLSKARITAQGMAGRAGMIGWVPRTDAQGNIVGYYQPGTNSFRPISEAPMSDVYGSVIPPKPTSSMLTQGQMSQTILEQLPTIQSEISNLADKIGPGAGRWNNFWVNKGGTDDPDYARLNQDLQLLAAAVGKAHFGARIPEGFVAEMMRDFGAAQSPDDLLARIESADRWVTGYASRIGGTSTPIHRAANPSVQKVDDLVRKYGGR